MRNRYLVLLALALASLFIAGVAAASVTASYSATVPIAATNWTNSLAFPKFDPSLGVLQSVSFEVRADLASTFRYENLSTSSACTSRDSSKATIQLQRPDATLLTSTIATLEYGRTMPVFDGGMDFGGTSGFMAADVPASASATRVITTPTDLTLFTGTGTIALPCRSIGTSFTSDNCGNGIHGVGTKAGAYVVVTYTYDNATSATKPTWGRLKTRYR